MQKSTQRLIYVAGAYGADTPEEVLQNIRRAQIVAAWLWEAGYAVICPHCNSVPGFTTAIAVTEADWLRGDITMMERCDAVLVQGEWDSSSYTIIEVARCEELGIPVCFSFDDVLRLLPPEKTPRAPLERQTTTKPILDAPEREEAVTGDSGRVEAWNGSAFVKSVAWESIFCDLPGCHNRTVAVSGWVERDGHWLCPKHTEANTPEVNGVNGLPVGEGPKSNTPETGTLKAPEQEKAATDYSGNVWGATSDMMEFVRGSHEHVKSNTPTDFVPIPSGDFPMNGDSSEFYHEDRLEPDTCGKNTPETECVYLPETGLPNTETGLPSTDPLPSKDPLPPADVWRDIGSPVRLPSIPTIMHEALETAKSKGFYEDPGPTMAEFCANLHSEASEIWDAWVKSEDARLPEEMADLVIRLCGMAQYLGVDLNLAILEKMAHNKTRSHRHGGRRA